MIGLMERSNIFYYLW